jgi:hypothetical protein
MVELDGDPSEGVVIGSRLEGKVNSRVALSGGVANRVKLSENCDNNVGAKGELGGWAQSSRGVQGGVESSNDPTRTHHCDGGRTPEVNLIRAVIGLTRRKVNRGGNDRTLSSIRVNPAARAKLYGRTGNAVTTRGPAGGTTPSPMVSPPTRAVMAHRV